MSKFTDALATTLQGHFDPGDQPTSANFDALILAIQEGIEEHDHAGGGDGDGAANLVGPVGIGVAPTSLFHVEAADGVMVDTWIVNIENKEATAGDNWGLAITAGSNASDFAFQVSDVTTALLLSIRGDGVIKISNLAGVGARAVVAAADGTLSAP